MRKFYLVILMALTTFSYSIGQCNAGEVEMKLSIHTDTYGYEGYWELVPGGGTCGTGTIISGGNSAVGCSGGGARNVQNGGYGNNQTISVPAVCLVQGNSYTIQYRDDWGDGGFEFKVSINGYVTNLFKGSGASNSFTFTAQEPLMYDLGLSDIDKPYSYASTGSNMIEGHFQNYGKDTIQSLTLAYQINNDPPVLATVNGLSIANYEEAHIAHPTAWVSSVNGNYQLKVWISQVNGNTDLENGNDTLSKVVEVGPGYQNIIDTFLITPINVIQIGNNMDLLNKPTDLDFHPTLSRKELWVVNKRSEQAGGTTVTYSDAGTPSQTDIHRKDGNAWHFMSLPTGIAFSENENFATSPGVYDANHNGGMPFTGPSLWSSDPAIYAQPSGGNGSHLDMLHESPECQGIASEKDNVFWVFDGYNGDIVRYDFADDHGPGNDDHSDGVIWRYSEESVAKDPNNKVISHLVYDKTTDWLYVVDYGNQRVIRIDAKSGNKGNTPSFGPFETLAEYVHIVNYTWETVVDSGLTEPAGIDIIDDRMLVSDYATGEIVIYDISVIPAVELGRLSTGAQGIMGIKIGPEGNIWYVDHDAYTVNKIVLSGVGLDENNQLDLVLYPVPSDGNFTLNGSEIKGKSLMIYSATGQLLHSQLIRNNTVNLNLSFLADGVYTLIVEDSKISAARKLIISK